MLIHQYADINKGYVYVTTDGVKNWATLFSELVALTNFTKVTGKSYVKLGGDIYLLDNYYISGTSFKAHKVTVTATHSYITQIIAAANSTDCAFFIVTDGNIVNSSTQVPGTGSRIELIY